MMSRKDAVWLQAIATAVPPASYTQQEAVDFMKNLPMYGEKERRFLDRIYQGTRIDKRHTVIDDYGKPIDEYRFFSPNASMLPEPMVAQRNDLFVQWADELSVEAARRLFDGRPDIDPESITHLITVTCTGFSAPGFDYHLVTTLGLSDRIFRYHIGFMGCYAGFPALRLARSICHENPAARVLIVDVELCTLHFQLKTEPDTMVANALFADGAAAAIVTTDNPLPGQSAYRLGDFFSRIIAESDTAMTWKLGNNAFDMRLSSYVPRLIHRDIADIVRTTMGEVGIGAETSPLWAVHPGGRAILDRVSTALDLPQDALADSFAVLGEYGNMSSATIFFVLKQMMSNPKTGPVFAVAFGPGLTVESARLEHVRG